ncbi:MAG: hypothetical protein ABI462_12045 [Ignavibacteria bacterium]
MKRLIQLTLLLTVLTLLFMKVYVPLMNDAEVNTSVRLLAVKTTHAKESAMNLTSRF